MNKFRLVAYIKVNGIEVNKPSQRGDNVNFLKKRLIWILYFKSFTRHE